MQKIINVTVIDSGIPSFYQNQCLYKNLTSCCSCNDELGHATAVTDIFLKELNTENVNFQFVKIFGDSFESEEDILYKALKYVNSNYLNFKSDVLIISAGQNNSENLSNIKKEIDKIALNTIIISAFDNEGSLSYPAAFENVIGVDLFDNYGQKGYEFVEQSAITVRAPAKYYRTKWENNKTMLIKGASFACAEIAGKIANHIYGVSGKCSFKDVLDFLKHNAGYIVKTVSHRVKKANSYITDYKKAITFPFNKEIHPLWKFSDLLTFQIVGCYDTKYSLNIGKRIKEITPYIDNDCIIQNYENIDWNDDFDTIILGHCEEISKVVHKDISKEIVNLAIKHNKNVYSFSNILHCFSNKDDYLNTKVVFPYVDKSYVLENNFGKLYLSRKPIVSVLGTSSKQGKYNVQLVLKRLFLNSGYKVGQITTEPSGYLFSADFVFPMGYQSTVLIQNADSVLAINEQIRQIESKDVDVILTGSQSGSIPYSYNNINQLLFSQQDFLNGVQPDVVVLCVNYSDEIEYIIRTIAYIESYFNTKVIGLVLFPYVNEYSNLNIKKRILSEYELVQFKNNLSRYTNIKIYVNNEKNISHLYKDIIDYL